MTLDQKARLEWMLRETERSVDEYVLLGERYQAEDYRLDADALRAALAQGERLREVERERAQAKAALSTVQSAAQTLVRAADRRVLEATKHEPAARVAMATLDSERAMNAQLTEENESLRAERDALAAQVEELKRLAYVCATFDSCATCGPICHTCAQREDLHTRKAALLRLTAS